MSNNNFIQGIRRTAKAEAEKDFAADWGTFWKVAGSYIGQYAMAIVGFAADFAVAFSMIYGATKQEFLSFLGAAAICIVIQYGYGGATFRIAKAVKNGKISEGRYMRSAIIAGAFGIAALGASLYLSFNFDAVFRVASEPQAAKELKDEDAINVYYDGKISALRDDYMIQYATLQSQRNELATQRNEEGVLLWTSRRTMEKMDTKMLPDLRKTYETQVATLETERAQRLQQVIKSNEVTSKKWEAKITEGAMFTQWFNISVNLLRVLLIIGYAIFLLDVYQDEEDRKTIAKNAVPSPYVAVGNPPSETTQRNALDSVANWVQTTNYNRVAAELSKQKAKLRAYRSKLQRNEGNAETNLAGAAMAEHEIERLEGILAGRKGV